MPNCLKIASKDFDLILESYNKAMVRTLTDKTRADVEAAKQKAVNREKKLNDFWK